MGEGGCECENALNVELLTRLPLPAVELADCGPLLLLLLPAAAAALAALFARHPPLPHLPHHAVAVAPRVAVLEVVRLDAMRGEEEVLQLRAVVRAVRLRDGEARLARQLEGLELVLQQTRAVSSGVHQYTAQQRPRSACKPAIASFFSSE